MGKLIAYTVSDTSGWKLTRSGPARGWMEATPNRFAYRCLPLTIANQAGWQVPCPIGFTAIWNGGDQPKDVTIGFAPGAAEAERFRNSITAHFGSGIVTFSLPWLFRTEPGINLVARGAPNHFKANCTALEGLVETDWSVATFTMNWKIHAPSIEVVFEKGEPICFLQPIRTALVEEVTPSFADIGTDPALKQQFQSWSASRLAFNADPTRGKTWQKHYHHGVTTEGAAAPSHRTALKLAEFEPAREEGRAE